MPPSFEEHARGLATTWPYSVMEQRRWKGYDMPHEVWWKALGQGDGLPLMHEENILNISGTKC